MIKNKIKSKTELGLDRLRRLDKKSLNLRNLYLCYRVNGLGVDDNIYSVQYAFRTALRRLTVSKATLGKLLRDETKCIMCVPLQWAKIL